MSDNDWIEEEDETVSYGFPLTMNPHEFVPDEECCSAEEIARWKSDCEIYDSGVQIENPREGSGWYLNAAGEAVLHMLTTAWGIGTNYLTPRTVAPDFGPHVAKEQQP